MAEPEDSRRATAARYVTDSRDLEITLDDGSRHLIPVDRLEMVKNTSDAFAPIEKPTNEQLADVKIWGGGASIYWESIEQIFLVEELMAGVYGRPAWMKRLLVSTQQSH